jgi:hypothetical protein
MISANAMSYIVGATLAPACRQAGLPNPKRAEALVLSTIEGSSAPTTCENLRPKESFEGSRIKKAGI